MQSSNMRSNDRPAALVIANVTEPVVLRYFETLNAGEFEATSELFAVDGVMQPPFEDQVVGRRAIANYLKVEATDLNLQPQEGTVTELEDDYVEVRVTGKVKTSWFGVNVLWLFLLNSQREIAWVEVRLLASPQELLGLRR